MGYYAESVEVNFRIPAENAEAALAAVNARFGCSYHTLAEATENITGFIENETDPDGAFELGYQTDKYSYDTEAFLEALAAHAVDGSVARFCDNSTDLWGFRVADGQLWAQEGDYLWTTVRPVVTRTATGGRL